MKVESESEVAQSCPTLSDPMYRSLPGSSILGIFQARVLEWGANAFSELSSETLLSSLTFVICRLFNYGHSDQCEVVPHYSFDLHFSNN